MAATIVTFAIDKLIQFANVEANLLGGLSREILSIANELRTIKSILEDAEKRAEDDNSIKEWLSQVREVSYQIEDAMDEYLLLKRQQEATSWSIFLKATRHFWQLRSKHKLASTIRDITKETQEINCRRQRYEFITTQGEQIQEHHSWKNQRVCSAYVDDSELVGIDGPKNELICMLDVEQKSETYSLISVVGMGGVGKTTLVRKVYEEVKSYFNLHAWITVSQSYNTVDLLKSIFKQFLAGCANEEWSSEKINSLNDLESVTSRLRDYLHQIQKRHIVVLDDVWDMELSLCIKAALNTNNNASSRVLMTTRNQEVANSWTSSLPGKSYNLQPLSSKESWDLFCKKAFGIEQCPQELEELSRAIMKKCNGLPLAIVALGGLLSTKRKVVPEWMKLHDSLGFELQGNSHLKSSMRILLLSYHELPHYLKPCFLYLGMFPEDYSIKCMRLARLWIAEGFVKSNRGKTPEEVAHEYITALIHRNLFQVSKIDVSGRYRKIRVHDILKGSPVHNASPQARVHDILREIILSKIEESGFSQVLSKDNPLINIHFRRLSIHDSFVKEEMFLQNFSTRCKFRSVLSKGHEKLAPKFFSGSIQKSVCFLRVLDLQCTRIHEVPEEVGSLYFLQHLSLRNTQVKKLPKRIGQLRNLQTLDLKKTDVFELPREVKHLHKLRHLLGYRYIFESPEFPFGTRAIKIPKGILSNFKELQKLAVLDGSSPCQVIELRSLKQLRRLAIINLKKKDGVALCHAIQEMKHLKSMYICASGGGIFELLDLQVIESPPLSLERLYLTGLLEKLPNWITKLNNLATLVLRWSRLNDDPVSPLQGLSSLVYMELTEAFDGETLDFGINGFSKLERLNLSGLQNLKSIKGSLPRLVDSQVWEMKLQQLVDVPPHVKRIWASRCTTISF